MGRNWKVGDFVELWDGCYGLIVASSLDDLCIDAYPNDIWTSVEDGVFLLTNEIGLTHYPLNDQDLKFIGNHYSALEKIKDKNKINDLLDELIGNQKN